MPHDTILKLRCTKEFKAALERVARKERRSLSDFCRIVLEDYIAARAPEVRYTEPAHYALNESPPAQATPPKTRQKPR